VTARAADGTLHTVEAEHVLSSAPLRDLVEMLSPLPSAPARAAAAALRYRDFLTVALVLETGQRLPDHWLYIHDPDVRVARIVNPAVWTPEMVPDPRRTCYVLEYFCCAGDDLWSRSDQALLELAGRELETLGLGRASAVADGCVVRQPKAYPVYDDHYATHVATIRRELDRAYPGLHPVGRNGMHHYDNQDHAMMTAILTAENILAGRRVFDPWQVNQDAQYHEDGRGGGAGVSGLRQVPRRLARRGGTVKAPP
jgi:protoporphyrinogen oxidase